MTNSQWQQTEMPPVSGHSNSTCAQSAISARACARVSAPGGCTPPRGRLGRQIRPHGWQPPLLVATMGVAPSAPSARHVACLRMPGLPWCCAPR